MFEINYCRNDESFRYIKVLVINQQNQLIKQFEKVYVQIQQNIFSSNDLEQIMCFLRNHQQLMIYYQDESTGMFVLLQEGFQTWIKLANNNNSTLVLKIRNINKDMLQQLILEQQIDQSSNHKYINKQIQKRIKERNISDVLEKVALWRILYSGFLNENKNKSIIIQYIIQFNNHRITQFPLDVSAKNVGISKKTLDDYLNQIRLGKRFGFDFNKYKNEKVGLLRQFVRKQKFLYFEYKQYLEQQQESIKNEQNKNFQNHIQSLNTVLQDDFEIEEFFK